MSRVKWIPEFTTAQLERLANIFDNAGQVFLAVMVLTPVVQGIDKSLAFPSLNFNKH